MPKALNILRSLSGKNIISDVNREVIVEQGPCFVGYSAGSNFLRIYSWFTIDCYTLGVKMCSFYF